MADKTYLAPRGILGIHEPGGEHLLRNSKNGGWILFLHALGHDPYNVPAMDYTPWVDKGFGIIARLSHGYGTDGTIPLPGNYDAFAETVMEHIRKSKGCGVFTIGNEMNHEQERPNKIPTTPAMYALCYAKCYKAAHSIPGSKNVQIALGPVGPYNDNTKYFGNETGDWIKYWTDCMDILHEVYKVDPDALTLHAYTHGPESRLVFSEDKMGAPFTNRRYHFRTYRDSMDAIPSWMRQVPVYITETNQYDAWTNANNAWVQTAADEIDTWNSDRAHQQIRALIIYRWPRYDKWAIDGKTRLYQDIEYAAGQGNVWYPKDTDPEPNNIFRCPGCGRTMEVMEVK